ncbi:MAG: hypothetical protein J4432_02090 [DPANN group archaeon]|nr:hypothetical protein [DPANN group archaeon]
MNILIDVVGTLFGKDKLNSLYGELYKSGLTRRLQRRLRTNWVTGQQVSDEKVLDQALETRKGRRFFREWLSRNVEDFAELQKAITDFRRKTKSRVLINTSYSPRISTFISKQLRADGVTPQKRMQDGYIVDDLFKRHYRLNKIAHGHAYAIPSTGNPRSRQARLEEFGVKIQPKNVADLVRILHEKNVLNRIQEQKKKKTEQRRLW